MVGVLKALQVEKDRYHQELQEYRKEAAQTLRSQTNPRIEVKRPELPKELEVLLVDAVQKNQNHKQRSAKQKRAKTKVLKSSEAVWKDVSNVLGSSEKYLPIAEKYFKRVFDLIQNPDSLLDGESLWNEEDEDVHEQLFGGPITFSASEETLERKSGEKSSTGRKTSSTSDTEASSKLTEVGDRDENELAETFQPIIIDHTKGREKEEKKKKKEKSVLPKGKEKGRKRSLPSPKLPTVEVKRENVFANVAEDQTVGSRNLQTAVNVNLDPQVRRRESSSDSGGVPSSATEIRRKAQEFLVELDLLQNLGSNLQTKIQVRKESLDGSVSNASEEETRRQGQQEQQQATASRTQPQYVSMASSPIVVSGDREVGSARNIDEDGAREGEVLAQGQQSISVQASLQEVGVGPSRESSQLNAAREKQKANMPTTSFFSDVIRSGTNDPKDANLMLNQEDRLLERKTSFSAQQEKADTELYKKLGIDSYDTASKVDKIFADSTVSPAMEVVERLLGGQYDYQAKYLECSIASQRLDKIKADIRETPISTLDFEANFTDEVVHDSKDDFEVSKKFVSATLEDLFSDRTIAPGSAGQELDLEGALLTDFYDIPKHLQRAASSQHSLAFHSAKNSAKQALPKSTGKYDHIKSKLAAATVDNNSQVERLSSSRPSHKVDVDNKLLKSSTSTLIEKLKSRERPRPKKKIEMSRKDAFAPTRKLSEDKEAEDLPTNVQEDEAEVTHTASLKQSHTAESDLEQQEGPDFSPEKPRRESADISYNKSRYQSKRVAESGELAASVPLVDPRQDFEERIKKLEEIVEQKNESKSQDSDNEGKPKPKAEKADERMDSQVQTDLSSLVEQSVQTETDELVEMKGEELQSSGIEAEAEAEAEDGDEFVTEGEPQESTFDAVTDVAIEDIVPDTGDAYPSSLENPLNFDGENEEFAVLEDQITFEEIQTQFKQEITLDNVVEEIIGRILSEEVENELQQKKIKEDLSSDEINEVVHTEISKLYRSTQTSVEEATKYTDDFNEMFLAHATIVALLKQENISNVEETSIENLEFTDSPPDQTAMMSVRRASPRSAWESGHTTQTELVLESKARPSFTPTKGFDAEDSNVEVSVSGNEEDLSSSTSPAYYSGSKSSDSEGAATPPTPATPRSYDEVMSSVESKMKVFEQGSSTQKTQETNASVVRKLDLQEEASGSLS